MSINKFNISDNDYISTNDNMIIIQKEIEVNDVKVPYEISIDINKIPKEIDNLHLDFILKTL